MQSDEARELLDYHVWARERMLAAVDVLTAEQLLRDVGNSFGSLRDTVAHLYGADEVWLARWRGEAPTALPDVTRYPTVASLRTAWRELTPHWQQFAGGLNDARLAQELSYTAFNGQRMTFTLSRMLRHLVNHGSYHRGQITTMLRQVGAKPAQATDLMVFLREAN